MRYPHLFEQIYHRPWFITGPGWLSIHQTFQHALARRGLAPTSAVGETEQELLNRFDKDGIKFSDMVNARQSLQIDADGIARVHLLGPLARNLSNVERACGATGYEQLHADLAQARERRARGLLIIADSPGGTVNGAHEAAQDVAATAALMPVVVQTADLLGSAAYYVAAGATKIIATHSAYVGSIGTLIPWRDFSAALKMEGLVGEPIANKEGDLKGAGFVTGSLTAAQRAHYEAEAQAMFEDFRAHVLTYRDVPAEAMRGQALYGTAMKAANLIDAYGDAARAREILLAEIK